MLKEINKNDFIIKAYNELNKLDFIPRLVIDGDKAYLDINDGKSYKSLDEAMLIEVAGKLGMIRAINKGLSIANLNNEAFIFDNNKRLIAINTFDSIKESDATYDLAKLILNNVDLVEEMYPLDYAINLIFKLIDAYNPKGEYLDLGYILYWHLMDRLEKLSEDDPLYNKTKEEISFVVEYKDYFDEEIDY